MKLKHIKKKFEMFFNDFKNKHDIDLLFEFMDMAVDAYKNNPENIISMF